MFGLIGPNGAGKSTLMKILATLLEPDTGSATLDGLDLVANKDETRRLRGYLPQEFGVYPKMSAVDYVEPLGGNEGNHEEWRTKGDCRRAAPADELVGCTEKGAGRLFGGDEAAIWNCPGAAGQSEINHRG